MAKKYYSSKLHVMDSNIDNEDQTQLSNDAFSEATGIITPEQRLIMNIHYMSL